jgi:hypothetical protein
MVFKMHLNGGERGRMVLNDDTLVLKSQLERDTAQYGTQQGLGQRIVMCVFFSMKKM